MNAQIEEVLAALYDSECNRQQIRLVVEHAYKLGLFDGKRTTLEQIMLEDIARTTNKKEAA